MTEAAEFHLSDRVRSPTMVGAEAEEHGVIIHRRGKADLLLTLASRAEQADMDETLVRLLARSPRMRTARCCCGPSSWNCLELYPWTRFLPEKAAADCVTDLLGAAIACASVGNFSAYGAEVEAWRSTAEIHSDPELYARLSVRSRSTPAWAPSRRPRILMLKRGDRVAPPRVLSVRVSVPAWW